MTIASEVQPFAKTGGLADVTASLAQALGRLGHRVTLITPRYRGSTSGEFRQSVRARLDNEWFGARLLEAPLAPGVGALLVDCPPLYDRASLYTEDGIDYPDNAVRFALLSIAALEWAAVQPALPSVIHAHDWQAGLAPVYARSPRFAALNAVPCVLTIHNLAYQGIFEKSWVPRLGLRWEDFTAAGFEFWDRLSFLKAGITFSDALTTVSPTYAEEIQQPEYGCGLEGVLRARRPALTGILNGIDVDEWNPSTDPHLPVGYEASDLSGKRLAKRALLEVFGLSADGASMERPVVGMVSRLVEQKGFDLVEAVAGDLPSLDATFVVVGTGDPRFERLWRRLAQAHPDRIGVFIGFDERRAHLVEGGADVLLMPSRFEPCGLNQMYSLRYGTVPVVRAVGGLADTVRPYNPSTGDGTGFVFDEYDPSALLAALRQALETYRQPEVWRRLQRNGMSRDFSWGRSAAEYLKVYKEVMGARRKRPTIDRGSGTGDGTGSG